MNKNDQTLNIPTSSQVQRYLLLNHWDAQSTIKSGSYKLYRKLLSGNDFVEIALPISPTLSDLSRRLQDVLRTLSQFEDRTEPEIILDIRSLGFDRIRTTLPDQVVRNDTIDLGTASKFIDNMRNLLAATASAEVHPERALPQIRREGTRFANQCRFGHTFRGSFGFMVESPITPNMEPTLMEGEQSPPFERKVIERLASGLSLVQKSSDELDPDIIVGTYAHAFNANMCDGLVEIVNASSAGEVTFDFSFSPEWEMRIDQSISLHRTITHRELPVLIEAAKQLRVVEYDRRREIYGFVESLRADGDLSDLLRPVGSRQIVVKWPDKDFGNIKVHMYLGSDDYLYAVDAHRNSKPIKVTGELDRIGNYWLLNSPTLIRDKEAK